MVLFGVLLWYCVCGRAHRSLSGRKNSVGRCCVTLLASLESIIQFIVSFCFVSYSVTRKK